MHLLRDELCYRAVVDEILDVPKNAATRDTRRLKEFARDF